MVAVAGDERAHDTKLVRKPGESCEGAAEGDAGDGRFDLARGAADGRGRVHLRIERLELRRPAVHEEKDDGTILEGKLPPGRAARTANKSPSVTPPSASPPARRNWRRRQRPA